MNRFAIIMIVLVIGFVGFIITTREDSGVTQGEQSAHITGEGTSGVVFREFADFQCPACGQYYPIIDAVKEVYGDEVSFQFSHFALLGVFPNSMAAHLAAEAAGNQGQFFEMHDLIFERQESWSSSNNAKEIFDSYAQELGLDMDQYAADYADPETRATINADIALGRDLGVTGTPTFFINDQRIENPSSPDEFFELIDAAIEETTGAPSVNSPRSQTDGDAEQALPEDFNLEDVVPTEDAARESEE